MSDGEAAREADEVAAASWDGMALPTGTVTLLLGDVEGSTRLWEARPDEMAEALANLNALIDRCVSSHDGARPVEQGEGDSFVAAFARCSDAVACALELARGTGGALTRLRMGLHTGEVRLRDGGNYMGPAVNRAARIRDAGHGGQVLLSRTSADLAADELPAGASLVDLGEHWLRDLARAERIWQLAHPDLPTERRPLRTARTPGSNLPAPLTSFVGRRAELAALTALLEDSRALTLTGAGGCGKTRLAVELSTERLDAYPGGVWFAELASTNAADGVEGAVASAIGVVLQSGPAVDAIARAIGTAPTLVVLDNCEHLVGACAALVEQLLRRCPGLVVVATSREPLGLAGEVTFRVPSLSLPMEGEASAAKAGELERFEAVQLFVDRARRARPSFALDEETGPAVLDICRRLDGIPLAIELAAARLRVLSAAEVRDGLHDRFRLLTGGARTAVPRQQTLQASVDWSYGLLLDAERTLLNRLSVFVGGFDLAASEAVCTGAGIEAHHVLDLLTQLVDKSLVLAGESPGPAPARFWLLETVRSFGAARLLETGEAAAVRARHYEWCLHLAHREDGDERAYRNRVANDYDNIRRALQWAEGQQDPAVLARLSSRLYLFWATGRHMVEGAGWFDKVAASEPDPARQANAVGRLALLFALAGDYGRAMAEGHRAVEMTRALGDPRRLAWTLLYLAQSFPVADEQAAAVAEALELAEATGDTLARAWALSQQGWQRQDVDPLGALAPLEASMAIAREHGYGWIERMSAATLAIVHIRVAPLPEVVAELETAVAALREAGEGTLLGTMYAWLAACREASGDPVGADAALAALDRFDESIGVAGSIYRRSVGHGWVSMLRGDWESARDRIGALVDLSVDGSMHVNTMTMLALCETMCGNPQLAMAMAVEAADLGQQVGHTASLLGTPTLVRSVAARAFGDLEQAEDLAHDALRAILAGPVAPWVRVAPLDVLASILVRTGRVDDAVRLFAAADADAARSGLHRANAVCQAEIDGQDHAARGVVGDDRFEELWQEGAQMSWADAVRYAQRGRGRRQRPKVGWDALTPTEREVVELVAVGATNAEIAERLFMAVATVKTHLTHVYGKLGLTSRTQLAAAAVRRAAG